MKKIECISETEWRTTLLSYIGVILKSLEAIFCTFTYVQLNGQYGYKQVNDWIEIMHVASKEIVKLMEDVKSDKD